MVNTAKDGSRLRGLKDQVREIIEQRFKQGVLRPGDRILESGLMKELGVSRASVREALIELHERGYVQRIPNRSTYVTKLTKTDIIKLHEVRLRLEIAAAELVMRRLNEGNVDLSELERVYSEMQTSIERKDWESAKNCDRRFHRTLWELADNEFLYDALERLFTRFCTYLDVVIAQQSKVSQADFFDDPTGHDEIMRGMRERSVDVVRQGIHMVLPDLLRGHRKLFPTDE